MQISFTKTVTKQKKDTFIIWPRYCGECMKGYLLQRVPVNKENQPVCPIHKLYLWYDSEASINNKYEAF